MKTHLDLFSGIGGFAIAAQNCGYQTVAFCEKDPYAQQILKERFGAVLADAGGSTIAAGNDKRTKHQPHEWDKIRNEYCSGSPRPRLHDNIFTLNGADYAGVDLLTGGFPCQPFSVAGKRKGAADDRALWPEMLRVIDGAKPAWIIGENVAGIVTMELDNILSDLEAIGYTTGPLVIPACAVDARHRRDRLWVMAYAASEREREPADATNAVTNGRQARMESGNGGESVADAKSKQTGRIQQPALPAHAGANGDGARTPAAWPTEPELGRVAHGIPNRAHRLRGLGNAIVPQVAEEIIRAITSLK